MGNALDSHDGRLVDGCRTHADLDHICFRLMSTRNIHYTEQGETPITRGTEW